MDIDEKTSQTNTFAGGMDSDTSDALLKDSQYRLANNLRYITNTEENTGELHLVDGAKIINTAFHDRIILATTVIRQYGVIVWKTKDNTQWGISYINTAKDPTVETRVLGVTDDMINNKPSIVGRWEDENNVKIYLADGEHHLMMINILWDKYDKDHCSIKDLESYNAGLLTVPKFNGLVDGTLTAGLVQYSYQLYHKYGKYTEISPTTKLIPVIAKRSVDGKQVEGGEIGKQTTCGVRILIDIPQTIDTGYFDRILVYRIQYVQNGQQPTVEIIVDKKIDSNDIPIIDTGTSALQTLTLEEYNSISGIHIIPRVIESKDDYLFAANIKESAVNTDLFKSAVATSVSFNNGCTKLYNYNTGNVEIDCGVQHEDGTKTTQEQLIASLDDKHDYFNKNTDLTINAGLEQAQYKFDKDGYYGGSGPMVDWRFVVADLDGDTCKTDITKELLDGQPNHDPIGTYFNMQSLKNGRTANLDSMVMAYIKPDKLVPISIDLTNNVKKSSVDTVQNNYSDPYITYAVKSLKRDEVYRYGIVLYDKYGNASPVKWIADIRTPDMHTPGFETFISRQLLNDNVHEIDLATRPLGIEFRVHNLPSDCKAFEIVRCNRTDSDIATIAQGVVSRPGRRRTPTDDQSNIKYPLTPFGFISTCKVGASEKGETFSFYKNGKLENYTQTNDVNGQKQWDNWTNYTVYQFISPEISYLKDSTMDLMKHRNLYIESYKFLFGRAAGSRTKPVFNKYCAGDNKPMAWGDIMMPVEYNENPGIVNTKRCPIIRPAIANANIGVNPRLCVYYINGATNQHDPVPRDYQRTNPQYQAYGEQASVYLVDAFSRYAIFSALPGLPEPKDDYIIWHIHDQTVRNPSDEPMYTPVYESDSSIIKATDTKNTSDGNTLWYRSYPFMQTYIKLYEQSNNVIGYNHGDTPYTWNITTAIDKDIHSDVPASHHSACFKVSIDKIKMASELSWDQAESASTSNGKTTYPVSYSDKIDSIGIDTYNNFVSLTKFTNDKIENVSNEAAPTFVLGSGGRCALIKINEDWKNLYSTYSESPYRYYGFSDTIGTDTVQKNVEFAGMRMPSDIMATDVDCGIAEKYYTGELNTSSDWPYKGGENKQPLGCMYAESMLGTFLCNIRQNVIPYGGYTYQDRQLSNYYSYGDYFIATDDAYTSNGQKVPVFDGDCFIEPFEYVSMHKIFTKSPAGYYPTTAIIYSIPVETNINLAYTNGYEYSKNADDQYVSCLQDEPANVNGWLIQDKPSCAYNTVYSQNPTDKVFVPESESAEDSNRTVDYRVYHSMLKTNTERFDSWLKFQPSNYLDVDTRYGQITELRKFNNQLIFWQEDASGILSVNERVQTTSDDSNMPLILGTGGILARYDYFASLNGMRPNEFVDAQSDSALMWWDHNKHELLGYGGNGTGVQILSKAKQVQNFINNNISNEIDDPTITYDKKFNEFIINIQKGTNHECGSLVYSEITNVFTGTYNIDPEFYLAFKDRLYLLNNGILYEWNEQEPDQEKKGLSFGFGDEDNRVALLPYVKYVINKNLPYVKVYDQGEFGGRFHYNYNDETGKIDLSNLKLTFKTPLKQQGILNGSHITDREYSFRYTVPRNNNAEWSQRLRGKTMQVELESSSNSTDFSLQYMTTKFRISWS